MLLRLRLVDRVYVEVDPPEAAQAAQLMLHLQKQGQCCQIALLGANLEICVR